MLVLVNNLCVHVKPMHWLYCILKNQEEPPTPNEIAIAAGKKSSMGIPRLNTSRSLAARLKTLKKCLKISKPGLVYVKMILSCTVLVSDKEFNRDHGIRKTLSNS